MSGVACARTHGSSRRPHGRSSRPALGANPDKAEPLSNTELETRGASLILSSEQLRLEPHKSRWLSRANTVELTGVYVFRGKTKRRLVMDQRVQIVRSAIEKDCRRAWTITALARLVNLSPSRLRHLFKSETGITPNQFVKEVRLSEAEKLLRTTFLRVKEIMNRVGFLDESHFAHEFKKTYGVSPSKYRSTANDREK